jgi:hypothetical protein
MKKHMFTKRTIKPGGQTNMFKLSFTNMPSYKAMKRPTITLLPREVTFSTNKIASEILLADSSRLATS